MTTAQNPIHVVAWGTYDVGKPRVRILLRGLRESGITVTECHQPVWCGIEDKSQLRGWRTRLRLAVRWLSAYPALIYRYLRLPKHDCVLLPYLGHLDILVLFLFARLRSTPIVWDAFLSLYGTVVDDRQLVGKHNPIALILFAWEWLSCRAADVVLVDTNAHGRYFRVFLRVPARKLLRVFVGAETDCFPIPRTPTPLATGRRFQVLFYGQFIPLHGIETVVRAAKMTEDDAIDWQLVGTGQETESIRRQIVELRPSNLTWDTWVPYTDLVRRIHSADVCLGIFGATDKARRVIPNKVFQIIASGRPLITADTPAVRELLEPSPVLVLIPTHDPQALVTAVLAIRAATKERTDPETHAALRSRITPKAVVAPLKRRLEELIHKPTQTTPK